MLAAPAPSLGGGDDAVKSGATQRLVVHVILGLRCSSSAGVEAAIQVHPR